MIDYKKLLTYRWIGDNSNMILRQIRLYHNIKSDIDIHYREDDIKRYVKDIVKKLPTWYPFDLAKKILMFHRLEICTAFFIAMANSGQGYGGDQSKGLELMTIPVTPELIDGDLSVKTNGNEWVSRSVKIDKCESAVLFEIHPEYDPRSVDKFIVKSHTPRGTYVTNEFTKNSFTYRINSVPIHMFSDAVVVKRGYGIEINTHFNGDVNSAEVAVGGHRETVNIGGIAIIRHSEFVNEFGLT